jgi:hypothetical protein
MNMKLFPGIASNRRATTIHEFSGRQCLWYFIFAVVLQCLPFGVEANDSIVLKEGAKLADSDLNGLANARKREEDRVTPVLRLCRDARDCGNNRSPELGTRGSTTSNGLSTTGKPVNKVGNADASSDSDSSSDKWYWYVQYPLSVLVILLAAGVFGGASRGCVGHEKPNEAVEKVVDGSRETIFGGHLTPPDAPIVRPGPF